MIVKNTLVNNKFDPKLINKYGSIMALGNGYLGLRSINEEDYPKQVRGMYVAGIYNKFTPEETSELVNLPDMIGMDILIDQEPFSLLSGEVLSYRQELNFFNGELKREIVWKNLQGYRYSLVFQRFVSKDDLHLIASKFTITSLDKDSKVIITTGIDGQQTNFGKQHLLENKVQIYNEEFMQGIYTTKESGHTIALNKLFRSSHHQKIIFSYKNRQLLGTIHQRLIKNEPVIFENIGTVFTSLDNDLKNQEPDKAGLEKLRAYSNCNYDYLLKKSSGKWREFWSKNRILIESSNEFDQLAINFALYHLEIMSPSHDKRFSIGAKGLTGTGYNGHVFWDTEIFIFPFHLFTDPERAKRLLQYRYMHLPEAQEKARANGYEGALFPWESAYTGKEETPKFAAINIRTGKRQEVASAIAEHHIVADIAYAVIQYYRNTHDDEFMKREGLALLLETSKFWISRAEEENGQLVIKSVIGPDEYTEFIDNNAYTNYMAYFNVKQTLLLMHKYNITDQEFESNATYFLEKLYLPKPNKDKIIPQDDTFLSKPEIDLTPYKLKQGSQSILKDYSRQEVIEMQVLKQADVVMLLYLLPELFSGDIITANLDYYEKRTIHDSSLSKAIHAIVAARINKLDQAVQFFQEACLIDLGSSSHSADEGIHAASLGGIWLAIVFGFANISLEENCLKIDPRLPANWKKIGFPFHYLGRNLYIEIMKTNIIVEKISGPSLEVKINNKNYTLEDKLTIGL